MSRVRLAAMSFSVLLAMVGCRQEATPRRTETAGFPMDSRVKSVDLGNIGDLYDTTAASDECRSDSDTVVCAARNGRVDRWVGWEIPGSPTEDGDATTYRRVGRWNGVGRFEVIQVGLGHDSPSFLFWDREVGGWITVHPGTDSVFVSSGLENILVLGWTPQEIQRWDYWKGLGGPARHFVCTPSTGRLHADSIVRWIGPSLESVPLDIGNLETNPGLGCQESRTLYDTAVADYMVRPQVPEASGRDSAKG